MALNKSLADFLPPSAEEAKRIDRYLEDIEEIDRMRENAEARFRGGILDLKAKPPTPPVQKSAPTPNPQSWFSAIGARK